MCWEVVVVDAKCVVRGYHVVMGNTNESWCPFLAPSVRFEFWAPMRPRTRCQPNSARLPRTSEFPSTCVLPPSLPCPPFPPISKSHISPARSFTLFTSLNNYPLVFFRGLALPGRSRIPIYSFRDPAFFPFSSGGTYSLRVRLARSHLRSRQRGPHTSFLPHTSAWMCTTTQRAILMVHKLTAVATSKARLLRQVCPVP